MCLAEACISVEPHLWLDSTRWGQEAPSHGWLPTPITQERLPVTEACICGTEACSCTEPSQSQGWQPSTVPCEMPAVTEACKCAEMHKWLGSSGWGQVANRPGRQPDHVSREVLYGTEACICVEFHDIIDCACTGQAAKRHGRPPGLVSREMILYLTEASNCAVLHRTEASASSASREVVSTTDACIRIACALRSSAGLTQRVQLIVC